jgi:hypothetical protein
MYSLFILKFIITLRWKDLLRSRLVECGWRDQVKLLCREALKQGNVEESSIDQLVTDVTPKARSKSLLSFANKNFNIEG